MKSTTTRAFYLAVFALFSGGCAAQEPSAASSYSSPEVCAVSLPRRKPLSNERNLTDPQFEPKARVSDACASYADLDTLNDRVHPYVRNLAKNTVKVRIVHNELAVGPNADLSVRSNDTFITSKVKTRFLEASKEFSATHVKVVTQRGIVYLMGIVTRPEGDAAARIASTTTGVVRVVKLFEYIAAPPPPPDTSPPATTTAPTPATTTPVPK